MYFLDIRKITFHIEMFMTTMYRCRIKKYKTMEVQVFSSIAEAMKQTVNPGEFCFIKGESMNLAELTKNWKKSEATSLKDEVKKNPLYQDGILVKVTRKKVKSYYLRGEKSLCIEGTYSTAMKSISTAMQSNLG